MGTRRNRTSFEGDPIDQDPVLQPPAPYPSSGKPRDSARILELLNAVDRALKRGKYRPKTKHAHLIIRSPWHRESPPFNRY